MSGHSKWSTIKRKKGAIDDKRGKIFTKLIRELSSAVRQGGGDVVGNPRLRAAVEAARAQNMPKDNIERAIKKAAGADAGVVYEQVTYEGYGPGGTALLIECLTDNKNRTVNDVRARLQKNGGKMGENGSVSWMFTHKGYIVVNHATIGEDRLMELVLEEGADDVTSSESSYEVTTPINKFHLVKEALERAKIAIADAGLTHVPQNSIALTGDIAQQMIRLIESLEDCDDVQRVSSNFDIPEDELERIQVS